MQCDHAQEFFSEYIAGDLDRALEVTLENHLSRCAACTESVTDLRRLWGTLDEMPRVEPPVGLHSQLMERIFTEQAVAERAAPARMRVPAWRGLFQARALAYAAALIILLLGAEIVQVQRAALGPLGILINMVRRVPLLHSRSTSWMPDGQGGGTLTVRLEANAQANGAMSRDQVHVHLVHKNAPGPSGLTSVVRDAQLTSMAPTVLNIPLDFTPQASTDVLDVTLTPLDANSESETVRIPFVSAAP